MRKEVSWLAAFILGGVGVLVLLPIVRRSPDFPLHGHICRDAQVSANGQIFIVGHLNTDTDSIASAIAFQEYCEQLLSSSAHFVAVAASDLNQEIKFVLKTVSKPAPVALSRLSLTSADRFFLVDHNQQTQLNDKVKQSKVVGIVDHHALRGSTVVTELPIPVIIRPWGSASTIIAHLFHTSGLTPSPTTASLLLSGILSDTLHLKSPTSTPVDLEMIHFLAPLSTIDDTQRHFHDMMRAKSAIAPGTTARSLATKDFKQYSVNTAIGTVRIGFAVIETGDPSSLARFSWEGVLGGIKTSNNLDYMFLAVVDVVSLRSTMYVPGEKERVLALRAYHGAKQLSYGIDLGERVSRKKQFIPPLQASLAHHSDL
eukprot:m.75780 g.75780  ORF g.75780 m.75780 type:complete len:371 (+) comp20542_c0_seq3:62-1174(+)